MDRREQEILDEINKIADGYGEELEDAVLSAVDQVTRRGVKPKDALGMPPEKIEALYAEAYQYFNNGQIEKAQNLFVALCGLDGDDPRFVLGQGACFHQVKEYEKAQGCYMGAAMMDPSNPVPLFHAVDCAEKMGDLPSASIYLQLCIDRAKAKGNMEDLVKKAELMLESIFREIKKGFKKEKGE